MLVRHVGLRVHGGDTPSGNCFSDVREVHQKSKVGFASLLLIGVYSNPSNLEEEKNSSEFFDGEFPPSPKPSQHPPDPDPSPATIQNPFQDSIGPPSASISVRTSGRWVYDGKRVIFPRICPVIPSVFWGFCPVEPSGKDKRSPIRARNSTALRECQGCRPVDGSETRVGSGDPAGSGTLAGSPDSQRTLCLLLLLQV